MSTSLHYWLRERKSENAEVDFLWSTGKTIIPLEVKAGASGRLRSLIEICRSKKYPHAIRFDTSLPSTTTVTMGDDSFQLISLPLYMVSEVDRIVGELVSKS